MARSRWATFVATVGLVLAGTPAWAADGPSYPPAPGPTHGVKGVTSGVSGNGSGLPHTGIDLTYLWLGIAVLLVGVALVLAARRRAR